MKVFDITKIISKNGQTNDIAVMEYIEGTTFSKWTKSGNKFKDVSDFVYNFCIPIISAFIEYHKITGELVPDAMPMNVMMRKKENSWEPVLIDYGPGERGSNPIYKMCSTLIEGFRNIENTKDLEKFEKFKNDLEDAQNKESIELIQEIYDKYHL